MSGLIRLWAILVMLCFGSLSAATFTVSNNNASGAGSLTQAIADANANGNPAVQDVIEFSAALNIVVPGLPFITQSVFINGTSAPGYAPGAASVTLAVTSATIDGALHFLGGANNSRVEGLEIFDTGANSIYSNGASQLSIIDCQLVSPAFGNIIITGGSGHVIQSCLISEATGSGIAMSNTSSSTIGGIGVLGNTVIDNGTEGIEISNGIDNILSGNTVIDNGTQGIEISNGIDSILSGNTIVGNQNLGFILSNGSNNLVQNNLISGNANNGFQVNNENGTTLNGNYIGTNATGSAGMPNGSNGLYLQGGTNLTIINNVVSGNGAHGIFVDGTQSVDLFSNNCGVSADGSTSIPNGVNAPFGAFFSSAGIILIGVNAIDVNIGAVGQGNICGGSLYEYGIFLENSSNILVIGNYLGTNPDGDDIGNDAGGILIQGNSSNNIIGGLAPGEGNTIGYNMGSGIDVTGGSQNTIRGNTFFCNTPDAVDLSGSGNNGLPAPTNLSYLCGTLAGNATAGALLDIYIPSTECPENCQADGYLQTITVPSNGMFSEDLGAGAPASVQLFANQNGNTSEGACVVDTGVPNTEVSNPTICTGSLYTLPDGTQVGTANTYTITVINPGACPTIHTVNLSVDVPVIQNLSEAICPGGFFLDPLGNMLTVPNVYNYQLANPGNQCPTDYTLNLTVSPLLTKTENRILCDGAVLTIPGVGPVSAPGSYENQFANTTGCDSLITTIVTAAPLLMDTRTASICQGDDFELPDGTMVSVANTYNTQFANPAGCDSLVTTILSVLPLLTDTRAASICQGDDFELPDGTMVSTANNYDVQFANPTGCDSLVTIMLFIETQPLATLPVSICSGDAYVAPDGGMLTIDGMYDYTIINPAGCDTLLTIDLDVSDEITKVVNPTICVGEMHTLPDGTMVSTQNQYINTVVDPAGCDTLVTTNLSVIPVPTKTTVEQLCVNETFIDPDGVPITTAGMYNYNIPNPGLCDSIWTINLQIIPLPAAIKNVSICTGEQHLLPSGVLVDIADTYIDTVSLGGVCDSVITTNLQVISFLTDTRTESVCFAENFIAPDGSVLSTSGDYPIQFTNPTGCDSLVTIQLIVEDQLTRTDVASTCEGNPYTLPDGTMVSIAGMYMTTGSNPLGCDTLVTTDLSVNELPEKTELVVLCVGEEYLAPDGAMISNSGNYDYQITGIPCDTLLEVQLSFQVPQIAGTGQIVQRCNDAALALNLSDFLTNADPAGAWSVADDDVPEPGAFDPLGTFNIDGHPAGTFSFSYLFTENGTCPASETEVTIEIVAAPSATIDTNDPISICNENSGTSPTSQDFNALVTAGDMGGQWIDIDGTGLFPGDLSNIDFTGIAPAIYQFDYVTNSANAPCGETTYSVDIVVSNCSCPSVTILALDALCNEGTTTLDLIDFEVTTEDGTWSMSNDFGAATPPTLSGIEVGAGGATPGQYEYTFTLDAIAPPNCDQTSTQLLTVFAPLSAGTDQLPVTVCNNEDVLFDLTANLVPLADNGIWSVTPGSPIDADPGALDSTAGTFDPEDHTAGDLWLTFTTDATGTDNPCAAQTSFHIITILAAVEITAIPAQVICLGDTLDITAMIDGSDIGTITWEPGGILGNPAELIPVVDTEYTLTVENECGSDDIMFMVELTTLGLVDLTPITICDASLPANLGDFEPALEPGTGDGSGTFTWYNDLLGEPNFAAGPILQTGLNSATYWVVYEENGCSVQEALVLTESCDCPTEISIVNGDLSLCSGELTNLSAILSGSGAIDYNWTDDNVFISNDIAPFYSEINNTCMPIMRTVTLSATCAADGSAIPVGDVTVIITIYPEPQIALPTGTCELTVVDACVPPNVDLIIEYDDGTGTWTAVPPVAPSNGDMLDWQAHYGDLNGNGVNICESIAEGTLTASCVECPAEIAIANVDTTVCSGAAIDLATMISGAGDMDFTWSDNDVWVSTDSIPVYTASNNSCGVETRVLSLSATCAADGSAIPVGDVTLTITIYPVPQFTELTACTLEVIDDCVPPNSELVIEYDDGSDSWLAAPVAAAENGDQLFWRLHYGDINGDGNNDCLQDGTLTAVCTDCPTVTTTLAVAVDSCQQVTPDLANLEGQVVVAGPNSQFGAYSWFTNAAFTDPLPADFAATHPGGFCDSFTDTLFLAFSCISDPALIAAGTYSYTIYPEPSLAMVDPPVPCTVALTDLCDDVPLLIEYSIDNVVFGPAPPVIASGDPDLTVFYQLTFAGSPVGCSFTDSYVAICPSANCPSSDFDFAGQTVQSLCDGDSPILPLEGVDFVITDTESTQLGTLNWFTGTDPDNDPLYVDAVQAHSGLDVCSPDPIENSYAYVQCDTDGDGGADEWVQVATISYQVYPNPQAPTINRLNDDCSYELLPACPTDVLTPAVVPDQAPGATGQMFMLTVGNAACIALPFDLPLEDCPQVACPDVSVVTSAMHCNTGGTFQLSDLQLTGENGFWTSPDGFQFTALNDAINLDGTEEGTFTITFELSDAVPAGCPTTAELELTLELPQDVLISSPVEVCNGFGDMLNLNSLVSEMGIWSTTDTAGWAVPPVLMTEAADTGIYVFAFSPNNECLNATSVEIEIIDCTVPEFIVREFPTAFTPANGDNVNNYFRLLGDPLAVVRLQIYNRYGNLLEEVDGQIGWDGKYEGEDVAMGVYLFVAYIEGEDKPRFGNVTLIR